MFSRQVLWPVALAAVVHLCSVLSVRSSKLKSPPYLVLPHDGTLLLSSVSVYALFLVCWTPLLVAGAAGATRTLPLRLFKQLQWLAMAKVIALVLSSPATVRSPVTSRLLFLHAVLP